MEKLVLYKKDSCPFCQKVMTFMEKNNIEVEMKDTVQDPKNLEYVIEKGGKNQVPVLFIDDKALYESDDIIDWMNEHLLDGKGVDVDRKVSGSCPIE